MLEQWNLSLFDSINAATAHPSPFLLFCAIFSAEILIYLLAGWMVITWIRKKLRLEFYLCDDFQ